MAAPKDAITLRSQAMATVRPEGHCEGRIYMEIKV
jgi:hypothetical protein